jgi:hypothetical protein
MSESLQLFFFIIKNMGILGILQDLTENPNEIG